jgi:two-component system NtrC family sensor kinase
VSSNQAAARDAAPVNAHSQTSVPSSLSEPARPAEIAEPSPAPDVSRSGEPGIAGLGSARPGFAALWAAAILVPLALFLAAAAWTWRATEQDAQNRLARTVGMLHEHALRAFETQEAVLEAVDLRVSGLSWDEIASSRPVHEFLAALASRTAPSGGMILADASARTRAASYQFPAPLIDLADRDYVAAHRKSRLGLYVGAVILSRPQNTTVFSVSRRRSAEEGHFDGLAVSSFKPGYFEDFYRTVTESPDDVVALVRDDGALLARMPAPSDPESYRSRLESGPLAAAREQGLAVARGRSPLDGRERLYHFQKVGAYPVFVVYGLDAAVVRGAWLRQLAVVGITCGLAAVLLLTFIGQAHAAVRRESAALAAARAEAERRTETEARLRHAQRIDALGQIVGGVAHDFNNVVMSVMAGVRTIEKRIDDPSQIRRITGLILAAAERGGRLTSRMLAFARREDARTEVFAVGDAMRGVCELLEGTLGSATRLTWSLTDGLALARGDQAEFESVIVNLVVNARDAMPGGGTVTVTAEPVAVAEDEVEGLEAGSYARITVADEGTGMDEATLARAGEAFFTTKEPGKGTGLGLAMAIAFAKQAGGTLTIASAPGEGTTVIFWLAAAEA